TFRQTVTGGYVQADIKVTAKLQIRTGVRVERTENALTEFDPLTAKQMFESSPFASQFTRTVNATTGAVTFSPNRAVTVPGIVYQYTTQPRIVRHSQYHNYFPSLLLKYDIIPNLEFQAGVNKAISRPP